MDMDLRTLELVSQALKSYLEENATVQTFQLEEALKGRTSLGGSKIKARSLPGVQINELLEVNLL